MGQKTNSNVFRLGLKNKNWKAKYYGKNSEEFSLYSYQDLEIRKYLKQILKLNKLIFHDYKLQYSDQTLHIFVSYYTTLKLFFLVNTINSNQKLNSLKKNLKSKTTKKTKKRFKLIKDYKNIITNNEFSKIQTYNERNFSEKFLKSLTLFTNKKTNIFITFQNLNKGISLNLTSKQLKSFKQVLLKFRRDFKQNFFKETINILLICINKKNSARLLSEHISNQLKKLTKNKKHRFFLVFLKRILIELSKKSFYKINGIKIVIKGRFNGVPRTHKHILIIGKVPLQNFNANIDYYQSISYTSNGTFGVKTWICEN